MTSTFAAKADAMPGAIFVVGFDTAARVLESRFYPEETGGLKGALDHLRDRCCSFLVAGRATEAGVFHGFDHLQVPAMAEGLFAPIPDGDPVPPTGDPYYELLGHFVNFCTDQCINASLGGVDANPMGYIFEPYLDVPLPFNSPALSDAQDLLTLYD
jgi:hypothetical protein